MTEIKSKKAKAVLHKPFDDIATVLEDIRAFNKHLHLCCLLTYGCLLRPHREVRELTWGDFSNDLSLLHFLGLEISQAETGLYQCLVLSKPTYIKKV